MPTTAPPRTNEDLDVVSLFSGVGGIDLGLKSAGAKTRVLCEYDPAARAVLARRFAGVPIHHDVRELTADDLHAAGCRPKRTILVAGFPCQDLSIAGARRGMGEGTRSGLYWHVDRLLGEFRPAWVILENVPGLLSATCPCPGDGACVRAGLAVRCDGELHSLASGGACVGGCIATHGGVMGAVLGSLGERGYGFAYRVLDAQHFGVPQRRRRVVIVGRLGDSGAAAAQVLLEPEGSRGDSAPRVAPRPRVTSALTTRAGSTFDDQQVNQLVVGSLLANGGDRHVNDAEAGRLIISTLTAGGGDRGYRVGAEEAAGGQLIPVTTLGEQTHALTAEGHDASEDGTGITPTLGGARPHAVAFHMIQDPITGPQSPALGAKSSGMGVSTATAVRRLTPLECERLQGFPDGWTEGQADSHRYKQMGNAVAVPVFFWVGHRLVTVDGGGSL